METTKVCRVCKVDKPLSDYYKQASMKDGHLHLCKKCKANATGAISKQRYKNPEYAEKERERGRRKYYEKGGYYAQKRPSREKALEQHRAYKKKYPEKYAVRRFCEHLKPKVKGNQLHHWSYRIEHTTDVIELPRNVHYKLHRFMKYDQERMMYRDLDGVLLDTKERHIEYCILKTGYKPE